MSTSTQENPQNPVPATEQSPASKSLAGIEAFDAVKRAIVIAAHPDDLECVCGGTMSLLIERGVEVFSVNCTLGDIGAQSAEINRPSLAATRLEETDAASERLGIRESFNLGRHDGELVADLALRAVIARLYRITQADTLFTFDPYWAGQIHPDHRAAGQVALDAYMPSKMPLYHPEQLSDPRAQIARLERVFLFSTDRDPDVYVDITQAQEKKLAACMAHVSQFPKGEESLTWLKEMDAETGKAIGVAAAEAFKSMRVW